MALLLVLTGVETTAQDPDVDSLVVLGHTLLDRNEPDSAEAAFKQVIKLGAKAEGLNGLGLTLVARGRSYYRQAFKTYRQALGADKTFVEAQLNIARLHALIRNQDTMDAYRKVIKMAPDSSTAYIELAIFLIDMHGEDSGEEVEALLAEYMAREPDDPAGYNLWMESLADRAMIREIRNVSGYLLERFPEETAFLPAIGLAKAASGEVEEAVDHWKRYISSLPETTGAIYDDLSVCADKDVVKAMQEVDESDREAFLVSFWRERDASSGISGDGARAEHYRRVWYAIRHFSAGKKPWDRRGDTYVRYGEPEYRSRSGYANPIPSGAAQVVRDRLYTEIGIDLSQMSSSSRELSNVDSLFLNRDLLGTVVETPATEPIYPIIGITDTPWESWIYTRIGGGVEFVFVDHAMNGNFQWPLPPDGSVLPMKVVARLGEFNPGSVYARVTSEEPQYYDFPFGYDPLDFYYDLASFRGNAGRTRLEVYFGIPTAHLQRAKLKDGRLIHAVERTLTLKGGEDAFRKNEVGGYEAPEGEPARTLVELATLEVPAGTYRMNVEVRDKASGRWGLYSQEVEVPAIPDTLALSDLSFAWAISTTPADERFRKHVDGLDAENDVWVIPLPSRSYRKGRPFHIYYEIYSLTRNEFGQTSYEVKYTVDQQIRKGAGVFGAMATMFRRAMADREPQLSIGYEATGETVDEPVYIELDTEKLKPGYNRITVTVTDRVSGRTAVQQAILRLIDG